MYVEEEYKESIELVFWGEVGCEEDDGIIIMMDVWYGWRKNVKDFSIVVIGEKIYWFIKSEYVIK